MNDDSFSLKARRTTRIPLRIPVLLAFCDQETDKARTTDAWTLIVNVNGARVECKHSFEINQEVLIRVPHLGKSQRGMIVWGDTQANKSGGYECGIKLDKAENLWGVGFPPSDWTSKSAGIEDLLPSQPAVAPPAAAASNSVAGQSGQTASAEAKREHPEQVPSSAVEPSIEAEGGVTGGDPVPRCARERRPSGMDLTGDLVVLGVPALHNPTLELLSSESVPEPSRPLESGSAPFEARPAVPADSTTPDEKPRLETRLEIGKEPFMHALSTPEAGGTTTPSDRLSTIFHELLESALEQRLRGLVEGVAARMEARITAVETDAVAQVEQRIANLVSSQGELLEKRASEIVSSRQSALEKGVREYLASQQGAARRAQEEMLQETSRTMQEKIAQTAAATSEQLGQQAEEIALVARTNLSLRMQQEWPAIEKNVFARSQAQAEQAVAASLDELTHRLPQRIQEAELSAAQQMDDVLEERLSQFTAGLTARFEQLQAESRHRIEQQAQEIWSRASQAFLRHMVSQLNQRKQAWMQDAEGSFKNLADQNLSWTRRNMTQLLKNLGTSLVEQASEAEEAETRQVATDQKVSQEIEQLIGAHIGE